MREAPYIKKYLAGDILRQVVIVNQPEDETEYALTVSLKKHVHRGSVPARNMSQQHFVGDIGSFNPSYRSMVLSLPALT
jgi:hypothetical protein